MDSSHKISLPIIFIFGALVLGIDLLEIILTLIGVIPIVTPIMLGLNLFFDILTWSLIQIYFYFKGARSTWFLAGSLVELIPIVDMLPLRSLTFFLSVYLTNHPQVAAQASLTSAKIKKPATNRMAGPESKPKSTTSGRKIISPAQNA